MYAGEADRLPDGSCPPWCPCHELREELERQQSPRVARLHHHDETTECYCRNPGPPALCGCRRHCVHVKIEGIMMPDGYSLAWLRSDPNRPLTSEEIQNLRDRRSPQPL